MRKNRAAPALVIGLLAVIGLVGCNATPQAGVAATNNASPSAVSETSAPGTLPTQPVLTEKVAHPAFDSDKAFALLKRQCDLGVRPLGTPAHGKLRDFLLTEMKKYADKTTTQTFEYHGLPVTNVLGIFNPAGGTTPGPDPVVILAHWDTRPIADGPNSPEASQNPPYRFVDGKWNRTNPIMGANDGASGVAVILELARLLKQQPPKAGVILLLDDGEDYGDFRGAGGKGDGVELGSRYFAQHYREEKAFGQPRYGVLLDMVGGKNLILPRERNSENASSTTIDKIYGIAETLGYGSVFLNNEMQDVDDDHIALIANGIPTIDLIYPLPVPGTAYATKGYLYWHTLQDTADKCSAKSLKAVGDVVTELIYRER